jgi:hypothetical protein
MGETLLRADTCAGATADTIHGVLETHDHGGVIGEAVIVVITIHIIIILVFIQLQALDLVTIDKIEDFTRADLETAATTDAVLLIDLHYKGGSVYLTTPG